MQLTRMGHACVRLEQDGATLVIDPGSFSAPNAADGADAILITHEHADHFVEEHVRAAAEHNPDLRIWTNATVAKQLENLGSRAQSVQQGDTFSAAGLVDRLLGPSGPGIGAEYRRLGPADSLEF